MASLTKSLSLSAPAAPQTESNRSQRRTSPGEATDGWPAGVLALRPDPCGPGECGPHRPAATSMGGIFLNGR